jgi:Skp family chaperone for outer membrane proteins
MKRIAFAAAAAAILLLIPLVFGEAQLRAQAPAPGKDYFVPNQAAPRAPAPAPRTSPPPRAAAPQFNPGPQQQTEAEPPPVQIPMPPPPELPALPKGASPPAAVIGVIGVPEVMRASVAAQAVDKVITERREKLNEDAQKEQETWRAMQQALTGERTKLSPDQLRTREKELQDRITTAQRTFRDRNRIIQEQTQFALNQIQSSLISVIRQVSESHGMNLVLHRAQVALNVNEFDITDQVAEQLNKVLPAVAVPPEGVSPIIATAGPRINAPVPAAAAPKKP